MLIGLPQGGEVKVKLFTSAFRKVWQRDFNNEPAGEDRLTLNVPPMANGIYYLVVEADGKRWVVKWLVLG